MKTYKLFAAVLSMNLVYGMEQQPSEEKPAVKTLIETCKLHIVKNIDRHLREILMGKLPYELTEQIFDLEKQTDAYNFVLHVTDYDKLTILLELLEKNLIPQNIQELIVRKEKLRCREGFPLSIGAISVHEFDSYFKNSEYDPTVSKRDLQGHENEICVKAFSNDKNLYTSCYLKENGLIWVFRFKIP